MVGRSASAIGTVESGQHSKDLVGFVLRETGKATKDLRAISGLQEAPCEIDRVAMASVVDHGVKGGAPAASISEPFKPNGIWVVIGDEPDGTIKIECLRLAHKV